MQATNTSYEETRCRSALYEFLSFAFLYPAEGTAALLAQGTRDLLHVVARRAQQELKNALEQLNCQLSSLDDHTLENQYVETFGHSVSADCPPYEAEYGQAHIFQKSQVLADVSSFYAAFGVRPNPAFKDRSDHISSEMEFMHLLTLKEAYALKRLEHEHKVPLCQKAQEAFLATHLASWVCSFAGKLAGKSNNEGVYSTLATLLRSHMEAEFRRFGLDAGGPRTSDLLQIADGDREGEECSAAAGGAEELRQ